MTCYSPCKANLVWKDYEKIYYVLVFGIWPLKAFPLSNTSSLLSVSHSSMEWGRRGTCMHVQTCTHTHACMHTHTWHICMRLVGQSNVSCFLSKILGRRLGVSRNETEGRQKPMLLLLLCFQPRQDNLKHKPAFLIPPSPHPQLQ